MWRLRRPARLMRAGLSAFNKRRWRPRCWRTMARSSCSVACCREPVQRPEKVPVLSDAPLLGNLFPLRHP